MKNVSYLKALSLALALFLIPASDAMAQVNIGVDVMSRYVWRGADFGNSPSIQPDLNVSWNGLEVGAWGAMATNGNPDGTEIDFYASYGFATDVGTFSLLLTDYTFPEDPSTDYFTGEAHFLEGGVGYEGTDAFPVSVFTGMFFTNDEDYSIYTEVGIDLSPFEVFLGFTPAASALYGTTRAGVINAGVGAAHELQVTEAFSMGLSVTLASNPYANDMFMVFGISL